MHTFRISHRILCVTWKISYIAFRQIEEKTNTAKPINGTPVAFYDIKGIVLHFLKINFSR